jgi:hypothetical protein
MASAAGAMVILAGAAVSTADVRSYDGTGNNIANPGWGALERIQVRMTGVYYADGIAEPSDGGEWANPRTISNIVGDQEGEIFGTPLLSDFFSVWGQFVDHEISRDIRAVPSEFDPIEVPQCDPVFDPECTGLELILFWRSEWDPTTGTDKDNPRQQTNHNNSYIDGSDVYGNNATRADLLRSYEGGKLRVDSTAFGDHMPPNDVLEGMDVPPFGADLEDMLLAGDNRANVTLQMLSMHTLFVREHNRLCDELAVQHPEWDDEQLYQHARKIVGGIIQHITYNDWLPILLGANALPEYTGYDDQVDASVTNEFAGFAFRFGHSLINPNVLRLNEDGTVIDEGNLLLRDAFFAPQRLLEGGIDPILRGMSVNPTQRLDAKLTNELRNFLFAPPTIVSNDLLAVNIERARDHGLGSYNNVRMDLGLEPAKTFADITNDPDEQELLAEAYQGDVNLVDSYVGTLAEDYVGGGFVGEMAHLVIVDQFTRMRDGDRFWYQIDEELTQGDIDLIESTTLADVVKRNTSIQAIQDSLFYVWPDFDNNGVLNILDFVTFQVAFQGGDQNADMDKDGKLTILDFVIFQQAFTGYF